MAFKTLKCAFILNISLQRKPSNWVPSRIIQNLAGTIYQLTLTNCKREACPHHDSATIMYHHVDGVFSVMCSVSLPPQRNKTMNVLQLSY